MANLDTRDLSSEREDLKQQILDAWNEEFEQELDYFEEIDLENEDIDSEDFQDIWKEEFEKIEEIDDLEDEVGNEFEYGVTLIDEDEWDDYVRELLEDCGDIPKNLPSYIVIDWKATADNVEQDYSQTGFRGTTYFFRA